MGAIQNVMLRSCWLLRSGRSVMHMFLDTVSPFAAFAVMGTPWQTSRTHACGRESQMLLLKELRSVSRSMSRFGGQIEGQLLNCHRRKHIHICNPPPTPQDPPFLL